MNAKIWKKALALCLGGALLLPAVPVQAAAAETDVIRIGLAYGSTALPAANLQNSVGSGYRLGYFDSDGDFVQLAAVTGIDKLTMLKAENLYLSGGSYTATAGGTLVGCWYLQLPGAYADFDAAKKAAAALSGGFPAWVAGEWQVRVGSWASKADAQAAQTALGLTDAQVVEAGDYAVSVVETGKTAILFHFDGGSSQALGVLPDTTGKSDPVTWFKGYKYYGGFRYERINGGDLTVVNMVDLEDYISCVITWEMSASWPVEALKAQACCARTYALRNLNKHSTYHFDLCSETDCQAYHGTSQVTANSNAAAAATEGECIWYNGSLIEATYFSSDGGATENSENVWTNTVPYLRGVVDPYEASVASEITNYNWTVRYTASELADKLRAKGYSCASIASFQVSQLTPTGNVKSVKVVDTAGKSWTIPGATLRSILGTSVLRSIRFSITSTGGTGGSVSLAGGSTASSLSGLYAISGDGSVSQLPDLPYVITSSGVSAMTTAGGGSTYTLSGTGWGHSVGMSQYGAKAMAKQGYTYDEILEFYYTGVDVY
ncbi:SpoIID/LytB domain-containing protein [Pseudoflavonifractor phocaeensis]|uniref:SpoIID/LytB domain-containing protein n=1 Tax=Pseudoflavonifractor phocaeensis TaxID=1870988 RepID=UPI00195F19AB|nr:SpoIID/LytB domain-containing protein [Pseudoflavonifractor phocaeensis]MBM6936937.1 SpoIID/LytB domain-containing protein [Pseudoflavonifractor phocaeensis]